MDKQFFHKNTNDLLYLVFCALQDRVPDEQKVAAMDLPALYKLACFHSLQAICYGALERFEAAHPENALPIPADIKPRWSKAGALTLQKDVLFSIERKKLLAFLEKEGAWYLPLKGIVLRNYYPRSEWRQFADNDILFDINCREKLKKFMEQAGYTTTLYKRTAHDIYIKKPFFNFEMHVCLFKDSESNPVFRRFSAYYSNILARLEREDGTEHGYRMKNEDFYVYMLAHAYKHHIIGGTGLRTFVDEYVLLARFSKQFDWDYIRQQLETLGMTEFEQNVRGIAMKLFDEENAPLSDEEKDYILYYSSSGTYGTAKNAINNRMESMKGTAGKVTFSDKVKYCFRRLFPGMDFFREYYPEECKNKFRLALFMVKRLFTGIFVNNVASAELKQLKNLDHVEEQRNQ